MTRVSVRALFATAIAATALACAQRDNPVPKATVGASAPPLAVDFQALVFRPTADAKASEAQIGDRSVVLLEPDDVQHPTAWQGPLRIENRKATTSCSAPLSLVTGAAASAGASYLIAQAYSGSLRFINYVDVATCGSPWAADTVFSEGIVVAGDSVVIQPACECPGNGAPCSCSAGRVLLLAADRRPTENAERSRALTKRVIGVEFTGRARVRDPKTPRAALVAGGS